MVKKTDPGHSYYYAGQEKIELTPADDLFAEENNNSRSVGGALPAVGRMLSDNLRLFTRDKVTAAVKGQSGAKLKYPVFRSHGAIVVALPEVRVEESRQAHRAKLEKWLMEHDEDVTVVSRDDSRLVLKPMSELGADALAIANALAEEIGPEMAQVRFIRVVPRPSTGHRR